MSKENVLLSDNNISDMLNQLMHRMKSENEKTDGIEALNNIFQQSNLNALIHIHEQFQGENNSKPIISDSTAIDLLKDVQEVCKTQDNNCIAASLLSVLESSTHLLALLSCHDKIATKAFDVPQLSDIPFDDFALDEQAKESIKVVRLIKNDDPLGATIAVDESTGDIMIARILKGCAADKSGLIHANDVLMELNGMEVKGKRPGEIIKLLAGFRGPLTLKLIPGEVSREKPEEKMFVRCRFTYLPQADNLVPCVEAGLKFYPGDVLCVVSKEDASWWQAKHHVSVEKSKPVRIEVGLIPSLKLQSRREKLKRQCASKPRSTSSSVKGSNISLLSSGRGKSAWSIIRASFRRKRSDTSTLPTFDALRATPYFLPYEVVTQYKDNRTNENGDKIFRPIVLVGPQGVGRNELKDRLIDSNPSHFGVPVPHTSRPRQTEEEDGRDYHFVSRKDMEDDIRDNLFLEYGEYKGNLYGTSVEAVRHVIKSGLVCVLTPYPQALTLLRNKEFMPYIIFIKPPSLIEIGSADTDIIEDVEESKAKLTIERPRRASLTVEELRNLVRRSEKLETMYGRLFDATITNDNSDQAFNNLKDLSLALENKPQWVPVNWVT